MRRRRKRRGRGVSGRRPGRAPPSPPLSRPRPRLTTTPLLRGGRGGRGALE